MGQERAFDLATRRLGPKRGNAHHYAGRAEPTLTRARRAERVAPTSRRRLVETIDGGDVAARDAAGGSDTRNTRRPVHPHGAATTLTLWRAPILGAAHAQSVPQRLEQTGAVIGHCNVAPVETKRNGHRRTLRSPA